MTKFLILTVVVLFLIAIGSVFFFAFKKINKKRLGQALGLRLLLIRLPQKSKLEISRETGQSQLWKDEINISSQLFSILTGLKSPFGLEVAVHHIGEEIFFYAAVPKESIEFVSRQIEGLWKSVV